MKKINTMVRWIAVIVVMALATAAQAAVLVEYDAATAGAGNDPTAVVPAWTLAGTPMVNNGTFLLQDNTANNPTQDHGNYTSPSVPGVMKLTNSNYGIAFKVQPLGDIPLLGGGVFGNLLVAWNDDQASYNVTIDKFTDDVSGTGGLRFGGDSLTPAVTGIDWSTPHDIFIGYRGNDAPFGKFDFYLDGTLASTIGAESIARSPFFPLQDRVGFGDGTTAVSDIAARWYYVSIHDISAPPIPEPTTVVLMGVGMLILLAKQHRNGPSSR